MGQKSMNDIFRGYIKPTEAYRFEDLQRTKFNATLLDYSRRFNPQTDNLYIHGPVGSGKTHIAAMMVNRLNGVLMRVSSLSRLVRSSYDKIGIQESDIMGIFYGLKISDMQRFVKPIDVLGLDDIGLERPSEYTESLLTEILDQRFDRDINGLIVTSNLSLGELGQKFGGDRLSSRLAQICKVFSLEGEKDYRVRGQK